MVLTFAKDSMANFGERISDFGWIPGLKIQPKSEIHPPKSNQVCNAPQTEIVCPDT